MKIKNTIALLFFSMPFFESIAQPNERINPKLLTDKWDAYWITHPTAPLYDYGVFHFRKSFQLKTLPDEFIIHISADNRYRLFVNGAPVCHGPARGDFSEWFFETIDIAPFLQSGENIIAAMVWNAGEDRPKAQISDKLAFIIQGNAEVEAIVNTGQGWKVMKNQAYSPILYKDIDERLFRQYYVAGPLDSVVAELYPWGWEKLAFNDANWSNVRLLDQPSRDHTYHHKWTLQSRRIPFLKSEIKRFPRIARSTLNFDFQKFIKNPIPIYVPANTKAVILFDNGAQTNAYPELEVSQGGGSKVSLRYAETFILPGLKKEHRDSLQAELIGVNDVFIPNGQNNIVFRPLWTRSFRWLQLEIETGINPLIIEDLRFEYSAYPTEILASFKSDDPMLSRIWDASVRTQKLSSQETFVSDLYWEQMQYIGDTKVQGLTYLLMTGDENLYKLALEQFDNSRIPEGLTQSRYPGDLVQVIPLYSLVWVTMVHDYWMYGKDPEYIEQFIPGIIDVLQWFEQHMTENDLIPELPYWNFIDWAYMPRYEEIIELGGEKELAIHSLFYSYTLKKAVELFEWTGNSYHAEHYDGIRSKINAAVKSRCFDEDKGLYIDTPLKKLYSQHTNILAVLAGLDDDPTSNAIMSKVISDPDLLQVDMYFHFFLGRAINKAGLGNQYLTTIEPWKKFINLGMTTFGETVNEPRSECHAWSTGPAFEFLSTVCGVESSAPGFEQIKIAPNLGDLSEINGKIAHPNGMIKVELAKDRNGKLQGTVEIPEKTSGKFLYDGNVIKLQAGQPTKIR